MARVTLEFDIAAPPAHVFAFFIPQRMTSWYAAEIAPAIEVLGGAEEYAVGQKIRIVGTLGGRELSLTAVVTAYEWGQLLEWRFRDSFGVSGVQRWELHTTPSGTHLEMLDAYEMPTRLTRLMDVLLTRHAVRRRDMAGLLRLRRLVEHR